ncbi:MAG TPA: HD domain-containing protein [Deltaproteobacteria bacterium]|nr:HD domain-containing protein [Deltaproteobacteria bacterium]
MTPEVALELLCDLGAPRHLVLHHELVLEAAGLLCSGLRGRFVDLDLDESLILAGAALHDAGKIRFPEELHEPGSRHEPAGRELLLDLGIPGSLAQICMDHARWRRPGIGLEALLVALADTLWKGRRSQELEGLIQRALHRRLGGDAWAIWLALDDLCEAIAAGGDRRLARSGAG